MQTNRMQVILACVRECRVCGIHRERCVQKKVLSIQIYYIEQNRQTSLPIYLILISRDVKHFFYYLIPHNPYRRVNI